MQTAPLYSIILATTLIVGVIAMFVAQFYLCAQIGKYSIRKAVTSFIPFVLLYCLMFDDQVKVVCRDFPKAKKAFYCGIGIFAAVSLVASVMQLFR